MGAYIEHSICMFINEAYSRKFTGAQLKALIGAGGVDRTILGSDLGQINNPRPVPGFRSVIQLCLGLGYSEDEIRKMISLQSWWSPGRPRSAGDGRAPGRRIVRWVVQEFPIDGTR